MYINITYDDSANKGTFIISINSLIEADQQSPTSSTSKDDNKWSQLCNTPYWNTAIVPNTSPPVIIGGDHNQRKAVNNISLYDDSSDSWRTVSSLPINCTEVTAATINNVIIVAGGCIDNSTIETAYATSLTSVVLGQLELCD